MTYKYPSYALEDTGLGSWLSSFVQCGGLACPGTGSQVTQNELIGQVSVVVLGRLQAMCKAPKTPTSARTTTQRYLVDNNAWSAIQSDPTAVNTMVTLIVNAMIAGGDTIDITGCTPPVPGSPTAPNTTTPVAGTIPRQIIPGVENTVLLLAGGGLAALLLLTRR